MSRLADRRDHGDLPLQDHRPASSVDVHLRAALFACRVENRDPFGRYIAQGHQQNNPYAPSTNPVKTIGDVLGGHLWENEPDKREIPAWTFAMPVVSKEHSAASSDARDAKFLPIKNEDWEEDDRFKEYEVSLAGGTQGIPKGAHGIVLAGTNERDQESLFFPSFTSLVAANRAGDPSVSSLVYDLTSQSELDQEAKAPLHSIMRVVRWSDDSGSLAWQLADGGLDGLYGSGLVIDGPGTYSVINPLSPGSVSAPKPDLVAAFATHRQGGPFDVGSAGDQHQITTDADGNPVNALHLNVKALWKGGVGDGPLDFKLEAYRPNTVSSPFLSEVHLRWDPRVGHDWAYGAGKGKWRWQAEVPTYKPEEDGDEEREPEPPEPPETTPLPPLDTGFEPVTSDPFPVPVPAPEFDPDAIKDLLDEPKRTPEDPGEPEPEPQPVPPADYPGGVPVVPPQGGEFVDPNYGDGLLIPGAYFLEECCTVGLPEKEIRRRNSGVLASVPTYPGAVRAGGPLLFRPFASARGEIDLTRSKRISSSKLSGQREAPDVAAFVPVGVNQTQRWGGFTDDGDPKPGGSRTGPGGLAVLPASYAYADGLQEVLSGTLQPASYAYPWAEPTRPAKVFIPGGLASLEFSHPAPSESGQRGGVSVFQDSTGLVIAPRDADGNLTSNTALQITEGSVKVTGKLDVTGLIDPTGLAFDKQSATSIGGSAYGLWASDGTVSGTANGALYYDDAGTRRRVAAPLKHVAQPSAQSTSDAALTSIPLSWSGCGIAETSYLTAECSASIAASPVSGEGNMIALEGFSSSSRNYITIRRYTPQGMTSWHTDGVQWRHKVTAITAGTVSLSLSIRTDAGTVASASRSSLSSADGSYQWLQVAGGSLASWGAGDYIELELQITTDSSAAGLTMDLGRVEFCWL